MSNKFIIKVSDYISRHDLLHHDGHYLVALSGGGDSTAMLLTLKDLGYTISAAHCNFHLRGSESDRDENFCKKLCKRFDVDLHIAHFDTVSYASLHKVSIEMAARNLRYSYFKNLCCDLHLDGICVAHHRDDSVETVLLNIIRGTGFDGLTGIKPRNGIVLRPLLCVNRTEILSFLSEEHQDYVTDSTNLIDDVQRNKVRLDLLPLMRKINSNVDENIALMTDKMQDASKMLRASLKESVSRCVKRLSDGFFSIQIPLLIKEVSAEYVLWYILKDYDFNSSQVNEILCSIESQSGRHWESRDYTAAIDRNTILVKKRSEDSTLNMSIPEAGFYAIHNFGHLRVSVDIISPAFEISKQKNIVTLDAYKVKFPLTLRQCMQGDRFVPFGMKGTKLVSDFLTDTKMNFFDKRSQLVVADSTGNIIWLVGLRADGRYAITDSSLKSLSLEIIANDI